MKLNSFVYKKFQILSVIALLVSVSLTAEAKAKKGPRKTPVPSGSLATQAPSVFAPARDTTPQRAKKKKGPKGH